jgi:hypothetical protein
MRNFILATTASLLFAGVLSAAAGGVIQTKDGKSNAAYDIQAETVSGIIWDQERNRPGTKVKLWDLEGVRYNGQAMDEYNGLGRKLAGGQSTRLIADAQAVMKLDAPTGFDKDAWRRVQISCRYYLGMGRYLQGDWSAAQKELEDYIKECEKPENLYAQNIIPRVTFNSKVSGKPVANAGGLNRFYLDALESLGLVYLKQGDAKSATEKAFKPLQELAEGLSSQGDREYFDWGIRALRASARYAEDQKDYKGAREAYDELTRVAVKKQGGKPSRTSYEAQLKGGFMQILEGDTRSAQARFYEAIKNWEDGHKTTRTAPPRTDWINPDVAYLTAGSYVGMGQVKAASAKRAEDWAEALQNFSTSLAVFNADDELRSLALLGAAKAAAQLAEMNKANNVTSANYAKLADKYLAELIQLLPKTKAASDESLPAIQKTINTYKGD